MRALALAFVGCLAASVCSAAPPPVAVPQRSPIVQVDWQDPQSLPRRFRNHCATDAFSSRVYCSDHCGLDYQLFYCSQHSFGCCRVGFGYCDWNGLLRCHP